MKSTRGGGELVNIYKINSRLGCGSFWLFDPRSDLDSARDFLVPRDSRVLRFGSASPAGTPSHIKNVYYACTARKPTKIITTITIIVKTNRKRCAHANDDRRTAIGCRGLWSALRPCSFVLRAIPTAAVREYRLTPRPIRSAGSATVESLR